MFKKIFQWIKSLFKRTPRKPKDKREYKTFSATSKHDNGNIAIRFMSRSTQRKRRQKARRTGRY